MAASDARLVERIPQDESGEELRELYRRYAGELFGFGCNALGDRELAEEVVQDVFARLWRHAGDYDPHQGQRAHLALRDRAQPHRRRAPARSVRPGLAPADEEKAPEELDRELEQSVLRWQVAAALTRLSSEHREVIRLVSLGRAQPARDRRAQGHPARDGQESRLLRAAEPAPDPRRDGGRTVSGCPTHGALLGGYVLGALEPPEMEAMRLHLESCPQCAREERKLAGLPALLDTIEPGDVPPPQLSPELEELVLDRFVRERRSPRGEPRRAGGACPCWPPPPGSRPRCSSDWSCCWSAARPRTAPMRVVPEGSRCGRRRARTAGSPPSTPARACRSGPPAARRGRPCSSSGASARTAAG